MLNIEDNKDGGTEVPSKLFKNRFTWFLNESWGSYIAQGIMIIILGALVALFTIDYRNQPSWIFISVLIFFLTAASLAPTLYIASDRIIRIRRIIKNLEIMTDAIQSVFTSKDGIWSERWNEVADIINKKFYSRKIWRTPYFLFDGQICESFFRQIILFKYFDPKQTNDDLEKCGNDDIKCVLDCYQEALMREYNSAVNNFSKFGEENCEKSLPKDCYKNYFIWRLKQTFQWKNYCAFLNFSFYLFTTTWRSSKLLGLLSLIIWLAESFNCTKAIQLRKVTPSSTSNWLKYMAIIKVVAPGMDIQRWDNVANLVNFELCGNSDNNLCDCFFDGKDCMNFFKKNAKAVTMGKREVVIYELAPLLSQFSDITLYSLENRYHST